MKRITRKSFFVQLLYLRNRLVNIPIEINKTVCLRSCSATTTWAHEQFLTSIQ